MGNVIVNYKNHFCTSRTSMWRFQCAKNLKNHEKKGYFSVSVCNLDRSILSTKTYLFINFKENFLSKL